MAPKEPSSKHVGVNYFSQSILQFRKHDVIYDNMETLLQLNYNFEEQWGQLVDLIGYIQYHSEL